MAILKEKEDVIQFYNQCISENRLFLILTDEQKYKVPSVNYILNYNVTNIGLEKIDIYFDTKFEARISNYNSDLLENLRNKMRMYPDILDIFNYLTIEFSHTSTTEQYVVKIPVLNVNFPELIKDEEIIHLVKSIFIPIEGKYFVEINEGFDWDLNYVGNLLRDLIKESKLDDTFAYNGFVTHIKY